MKEFEVIVKKIFNHTHEYAINNLPFNVNIHSSKWTKNQQHLFTKYVHLGFRKAQNLILSEMITIEENLKALKIKIKILRKNKNKDEIKIIENEISLLDYKELILRHFADFIAWELLGKQYHKIRRFYDMRKKHNRRPTISESNISSIINAVDYYHEQRPSSFALMSDLTSFIDIGDILLIENYKVTPIEVKEGKKNKEIFDFLFGKNEKTSLYKMDDKFIGQATRVAKQAERGNRLINLLSNENGKDTFTDHNVKVNKEAYMLENYSDTVNQLLLDLKNKDWAYTIFEDIITIGLYQKKYIHMGYTLIKEINKINYNKEFPVVDYLQTLKVAISEPITYRNFQKDKIFDILFGRLKIILSINLDNFITLCVENNLDARYLSTKETMNLKKRNGLSAYEFNKQNIIIDERIILSDGLIVRMLFDFVKPSSIIKLLKQTENEFNNEETI